MRTLARERIKPRAADIEKISNRQEEDPFQVLIATPSSPPDRTLTTLAASTPFSRGEDAGRWGACRSVKSSG
jgi:hypothetical protein